MVRAAPATYVFMSDGKGDGAQLPRAPAEFVCPLTLQLMRDPGTSPPSGRGRLNYSRLGGHGKEADQVGCSNHSARRDVRAVGDRGVRAPPQHVPSDEEAAS